MRQFAFFKTMLAAAVLVLGMGGCSKDNPEPEPAPLTYTLVSDKTEAAVDEVITFSVLSSAGDNVTSEWNICDESVCFLGNTMSYQQPGTHTISAHMKTDPMTSASNDLTVTITGDAVPGGDEPGDDEPSNLPGKINPDATYVLYTNYGDKCYVHESVRFYVKEVLNGEVTNENFSGFKVGLVGSSNSERFVVGQQYYPAETGTFEFDAVMYYGANQASEFRTEKITVTVAEREIEGYSEDFYHRTLCMKWTATWCSSCPKMEDMLETFKAGRFYNRMTTVAWHSPDEDECYVGDQVADIYTYSEQDYNIYSIPTCVVDFNDSWKGTSMSQSQLAGAIEKSCARPASSVPGLAAETTLNGRMLSCKVRTTAREAGDYYIGALFVEDGVMTSQVGAAGNKMMQNHVVHYSLTEGFTTFGLHECGHLSAGEEYEFSTSLEIPVHEQPADFVFENCHIVYFVCRADASIEPYGIYCANASSVKVGESSDYEFEPIYAE